MRWRVRCVAAYIIGVSLAILVPLLCYERISMSSHYIRSRWLSIHSHWSSVDEVQRLQHQITRSNRTAAEVIAGVKDRVQTCFSAMGMKEYLQQNGLLEHALTSAENYLARIRRLVPENFLTTFPNHCWEVNISYQVDPSGNTRIHGKYGTIVYQGNHPVRHNPWPSNGRGFVSMACIPELFLAGFGKCGTRHLYSLLCQHPLIIEPRFKEPAWWVTTTHFTNDPSRNAFFLVEYLLMYTSLVKEMRQRHVSGLLSVDAAPRKMTRWPHFDLHENRVVNYCLLPAVIPEVLPWAKFLVVMRRPMDLLYSAFWFSCTNKGGDVPKDVQPKGPDIFHERVVNKINAFKVCIEHFPLLQCVKGTEYKEFSSELPCGSIQLSKSIYYVNVHKWLSVVPRSKFLFLTLEELSADTNGTMSKVWNFLDLPYAVLQPTHARHNTQEKVDYHHDHRLFMRNDTRELLNEFFAPYNQMLADLLGDKKFLWMT